jgi:hypothetical protein
MRVHRGRIASADIAIVSLALATLALAACGGSTRAPTPSAPSGLTATAGNGQVTLSWTAATNASGYNVYYAKTAGVTKGNGTKVPNITSTSTVVTGLTNDTTYFFVVTAFSSGGESAESNEASAQPVPPGDFTQASMTGTWRFNAIAAGTSPAWMRGTLTVDDAGAVAFSRFGDSSGATAAPAGLFPRLLVDPSGQIRDAANLTDAVFTGVMGSTNRNKVVGTSSSNGTQLIAVFLKHDPAVTFVPGAQGVPGDINGFGGSAGGARRFVYSQIATGSSPEEWEVAQGQIGANNPGGGVSYTFSDPAQSYTLFLDASNATPTPPGDKASVLSLTSDGTVTEALNTGTGQSAAETPPPKFVVGPGSGVMSDDKSTVVATTTDENGGSPRYVLRIYQLINIGPINTSTGLDTLGGQDLTFAIADLNGTYSFRELAVGASTLSASGTMTIDGTSGAAAFTSYADSGGSTTPPSGFSLAMDQRNQPPGKQNGILTSADASISGKLGDFKDMLVLTRTDSSGASRLTIALK